MRIQEIGFDLRRARIARGLTQARLATAAGVSRSTLNQFENGLVPELGLKKVQRLLEEVGLTLRVQREAAGRPDFIRMACSTASVSFRTALGEDELVHALLAGRISPKKRPHLRVLLDEGEPALLSGLVQEVAGWSKPGRIERNLAKLAKDVKASRRIDSWLKIA